MDLNRTSLYTPDSSLVKQVIDNSAVLPSPASDVIRASERKLTPMGRSPMEAEGSQVMSYSQERGENSSHANVRAY